jgi:hypothetical protein
MISNRTMAQIVEHYEKIIARLETQNAQLHDRLMAKTFEEYKLAEISTHIEQPKDIFYEGVPGTVDYNLPERN